MTRPLLVATDLDGTLIRPDHTISDRTARALTRVRADGVRVVAVTARPPRVFDELDTLSGLLDAAVCSNGALVYDLERREISQSFPLPVMVARKAAEILGAKIPGMGFGIETGFEVVAEPAYTRVDGIGNRHVRVDTLDEVWGRADHCIKLLGHTPHRHVDELLDIARAAGLEGVEVSHSGGNGLLEICAAGVSKAATLEKWCDARGVSAGEVVAFGDMPNDLPMLTWAATSYAVANAHPEVLAAATHHTASDIDDGVAMVLERW